MLHRNQRLVVCPGQRLGCQHADVQRTDQTRTDRNGNAVNVIPADLGLFKSFLDDDADVFNVNAAGYLWYDPAVFGMNIYLAGNLA